MIPTAYEKHVSNKVSDTVLIYAGAVEMWDCVKMMTKNHLYMLTWKPNKFTVDGDLIRTQKAITTTLEKHRLLCTKTE
ncbi:hypothetical protein ACJX0J_021903, partial [Zea mays]